MDGCSTTLVSEHPTQLHLGIGRHLDNPESSEWGIWSFRRMAGIRFTELTAFVAMAKHRSFTKTTAKIGIALPAMRFGYRTVSLADNACEPLWPLVMPFLSEYPISALKSLSMMRTATLSAAGSTPAFVVVTESNAT
jgi:hypothetical protein